MLSKSKIKFIHSLALRKNRTERRVFLAEGPKLVGDLLGKDKAMLLLATKEWLDRRHENGCLSEEIVEVDEDELSKASLQKHPQQVIAVFCQKKREITPQTLRGRLSLMLDGVQDPGNLGTIVRIADWFGIENVICSHETADIYNPKAIQATMGSIARVNVFYTDIVRLTDMLPELFPVYGTLLDGKDIYAQKLTTEGIIVMGNEGNGLSENMRKKVNRSLYIPNFPLGRKTADSLNVAIATSVICSEFRRQQSCIK